VSEGCRSGMSNMDIPLVDLKAQYAALKDELQAAVTRVMERCDFILGEDVEVLEREFAEYCGARFAVGVATGTDALRIALTAAGIGPGDEVITAANTFIATVLAISYVGATPVLVDVGRDTYNIDPEQVTRALTPRTKALLPVHLYGQPADMAPLAEIAKENGLKLIEDACQAHGALYDDRRAGSLGLLGCFSFYPGKNLGAYGDGGMVVTDDEDLVRECKMLRNYGRMQKYEHEMKGYNCRLDTIQAAILRVKLRHLDRWNELRRRNAELYRTALADLEVELPQEAERCRHGYHMYVIRTRDRDEVQKRLKAAGVSTGIHYPIPVHCQKAYDDLPYRVGDFPVTEQYAGAILSLPMYPELSADQIQYVADSLATALS